jgi:hypothetical protein
MGKNSMSGQSECSFGEILPLVEHQLHFVQSRLTLEITNEAFNFSRTPKSGFFLHSILQNSRQAEVTRN